MAEHELDSSRSSLQSATPRNKRRADERPGQLEPGMQRQSTSFLILSTRVSTRHGKRHESNNNNDSGSIWLWGKRTGPGSHILGPQGIQNGFASLLPLQCVPRFITRTHLPGYRDIHGSWSPGVWRVQGVRLFEENLCGPEVGGLLLFRKGPRYLHPAARALRPVSWREVGETVLVNFLGQLSCRA
ncbi:hypothetical protein N658DRAFT_23856 [Parathielavia hyrcaniae]|uniref:Uncharacterized protein n=1 Tax=Parathielavia hyrcaniae TaxID=113614 RepID=A0AAN6QAD5_9PEZI|nr:hypothetical protein N658DRAFT_23856 [Parathielavia hyrcaniae]